MGDHLGSPGAVGVKKMYKEHLKFNKKTSNSIKKWDKGLNRHLTRDDIQMKNKHMKTC